MIFKARVGFDEKSAPRGLPFCAHAIVSTEPLVLPDLTQDKRFQRSPLVTGGPHFRFYAGVPLTLSDGHSVGTLCVLDRQPKQPTAEQIQRLRVLARSAARFLESRRLVTRLAHEVEERRCAEDKANKALALLHRELDDAEAFVRTVLPSSTDFSGIFHWLFRPSRSLGGDGLGCSRIGEHLMAFHVMDVCGHGIASALLSVAVMFALRARALTEVDFASPSSVLAGLNRAFPSAAYHGLHFTMVYGVLDTRTGQLRYATAGHPAPLLGRPGQPLTELPCETGPLLGVCPEATWPESLVSLAPGDQLFAFSDGACELVQSSGELLPFEAFVQAFERARQQPDPLAAPHSPQAARRDLLGRCSPRALRGGILRSGQRHGKWRSRNGFCLL